MPSHAPQPSLFVTTCWTQVRDAARTGNPGATEAMGALCAAYWQPLYRYARRKGKSQEDSEDLVQGFLTHLVEAKALGNMDQSKGRFRAFLLAAFKYWMINEWKRGDRQKRGGGVLKTSLDWECAETGLKLEIPDERSPDRLFDREWALALLGKVLDDLEDACRSEGSGRQFDAMKSCLTADSSHIPYSALASELGMTDGAVRVAVHRLRKRYRHFLTAEITRTLASPEGMEEEMHSLFSALAG